MQIGYTPTCSLGSNFHGHPGILSGYFFASGFVRKSSLSSEMRRVDQWVGNVAG